MEATTIEDIVWEVSAGKIVRALVLEGWTITSTHCSDNVINVAAFNTFASLGITADIEGATAAIARAGQPGVLPGIDYVNDVDSIVEYIKKGKL